MFQKIRDIKAGLTILGYWDKIRKEAEMKDAKHLLASKTFWINVVGIALTWGGMLPDKYALPVLGVANIANRLMTNQPVSVSVDDFKKMFGK